MSALRVTECPNYVTQNLDVSSPEEVVRMFRQTDAQIFAGWLEHPSIYEAQVTEIVNLFAETMSNCMKSNFNLPQNQPKKLNVVVSGCGTSGIIQHQKTKEKKRNQRKIRLKSTTGGDGGPGEGAGG